MEMVAKQSEVTSLHMHVRTSLHTARSPTRFLLPSAYDFEYGALLTARFPSMTMGVVASVKPLGLKYMR